MAVISWYCACTTLPAHKQSSIALKYIHSEIILHKAGLQVSISPMSLRMQAIKWHNQIFHLNVFINQLSNSNCYIMSSLFNHKWFEGTEFGATVDKVYWPSYMVLQHNSQALRQYYHKPHIYRSNLLPPPLNSCSAWTITVFAFLMVAIRKYVQCKCFILPWSIALCGTIIRIKNAMITLSSFWWV